MSWMGIGLKRCQAVQRWLIGDVPHIPGRLLQGNQDPQSIFPRHSTPPLISLPPSCFRLHGRKSIFAVDSSSISSTRHPSPAVALSAPHRYPAVKPHPSALPALAYPRGGHRADTGGPS